MESFLFEGFQICMSISAASNICQTGSMFKSKDRFTRFFFLDVRVPVFSQIYHCRCSNYIIGFGTFLFWGGSGSGIFFPGVGFSFGSDSGTGSWDFILFNIFWNVINLSKITIITLENFVYSLFFTLEKYQNRLYIPYKMRELWS